MEAYESLITRKSIRYYKKQKIEKDLILKLIKAAMHAPSARNYQPWHFIILNDERIMEEVSRLHPYGDILERAPLAILVCGDTEKENTIGYLIEDCSAATENILIAAHSLGLGACWLGIYPREERMENVIKYFALPENIVPVSLLAVGYPGEEKRKQKDLRNREFILTGGKKINRWKQLSFLPVYLPKKSLRQIKPNKEKNYFSSIILRVKRIPFLEI